MSLKIIKAGMLDTIQDLGRYGSQHLGINPNGAMDRYAASLANAVLGKDLKSPVIEMHFPASQILFQKEAIVCVAGGNFSASINNNQLASGQPAFVKAGSILSFQRKKFGARCYLSCLNDLQIEPWLNSYSTNLKANIGGYKGRRLMKDDVIEFSSSIVLPKHDEIIFLTWKYHERDQQSNTIEFIIGNEWNWLTIKSQTDFLNTAFAITPASDRMGFRLQGEKLEQKHKEQLVSSPVNFGTIQLLSNGQLIVLMADHQTTGGYPRVGNIISADLPKLAQMNAGEEVKFIMTNTQAAEEKWIAQQNYLHRLQNTCNLKMKSWLNAH